MDLQLTLSSNKPDYRFGLSPFVVGSLQRVLDKYPQIESVKLFGSRAKGNYRDGSDIDLGVFAPAMSQASFTQLWNDMDALPVVFKVDLIHVDALQNTPRNAALKSKIETEGVAFSPA